MRLETLSKGSSDSRIPQNCLKSVAFSGLLGSICLKVERATRGASLSTPW